MRPRVFFKALFQASSTVQNRVLPEAFPGYRLTSTIASSPATTVKDHQVDQEGITLPCRRGRTKASAPVSILRASTKAYRTITTLDPKRLDSASFLDLSNTQQPYIYLSTPSGKLLLLRMFYRRLGRLGPNPGLFVPFPPETHGFLYFYTHPSDPLNSQLRFRVTESSNADSFAQGKDLTYGAGQVFCRHLSWIACVQSNEYLRDILVRDGLVDKAHIAELQRQANPRRKVKRALTRLSEPFECDFAVPRQMIQVCTAGMQRMYSLQTPLFHHQHIRLYEKGAALCCFERSTLPEHAGRRIIALRLLKMLEPPTPVSNPPPGADMSMPAEGELFTKRGRVWYRDLDSPRASSMVLRLLFDAEDSQGSSKS